MSGYCLWAWLFTLPGPAPDGARRRANARARRAWAGRW